MTRFYKSLLILVALSIVSKNTVALSDFMMIKIIAKAMNQPCMLKSGDELIDVDFGSIVGKEFQRSHRTKSKSFDIHLEGCDITVARDVKVTFSGDGDALSPSLLALSQDSTASGIAIGLEQDGNPLPLNQSSREIRLAKGNNTLTFSAYIEALPDQEVVPGEFNATAIFELDYN